MYKPTLKKLSGNWQLTLNTNDMANLLNMASSLYDLTYNTNDCNVEATISNSIHDALQDTEGAVLPLQFVSNALILKTKFADLSKRISDLRGEFERPQKK